MDAKVNIDALDSQLRTVCSIDGVSVGDWSDKATWRVDYKPEATDSQMASARSVVSGFIPQ